MGRKRKKTWEEMTELERLQEENERLRPILGTLPLLFSRIVYPFFYIVLSS